MRALVIPILLWIAVLPVIASGIEVSGDVWGTWSPVNNPYEVVGELRVPPESTLVIEPGVFVDFQGHYKFIVDSLATLLAVGTEEDSIIFTAEDPDSGWHGIRFFYASGSSHVSYCNISFGKANSGTQPGDACGGAIYCDHSSPVIANNTIRFGLADCGGAIFCRYSSPEISCNTITENQAIYGGGLHCFNESAPAVSDNVFTHNSGHWGGAISVRRSNVIIVRNEITGNDAIWGGAGIYCYDCDCTISNNLIMWNYSMHLNSAGGGILCEIGNFRIQGNTITENMVDFGGGVCCNMCNPTITSNTIKGNAVFGAYAGIRCYQCTAASISDNIIAENNVLSYGGCGAGLVLSYSAATVSRNLITRNTADYGFGGGIYCLNSDALLINNTVSRNIASSGGAGIICQSCDPTISNTIFWADSSVYGVSEIYLSSGANPVITYCDIEGGWTGQGNIDADPLFVDPENDDFHLLPGSPCIDAGDPNSPPDPDGTRADMGAFYYDQTPVIQIPSPELPEWVHLSQNFPNPFNACTKINYQLPVNSYVKVVVFNALGERVALLTEGMQETGNRSVLWDASGFASGIYFYRLTAGEYRSTRTMVLAK